jgi:hypothetical protein
MGGFPKYWRGDRTYSYSNAQLASSFMMAGNLFAVLCLCFGIGLGAFISAPPEQRIANVFFFGLIPDARTTCICKTDPRPSASRAL